MAAGPSCSEAPAPTPAAAPKIKTFAELMAEKYASADTALGVPSQAAKELNVHVPDEALKRARARQELWQRSKRLCLLYMQRPHCTQMRAAHTCTCADR